MTKTNNQENNFNLVQIMQELMEMNEEMENADIQKAIDLLEKAEEEEGTSQR